MNLKKVFYYCIKATNYISFSHSSNNYVTTNVKPSKKDIFTMIADAQLRVSTVYILWPFNAKTSS